VKQSSCCSGASRALRHSRGHFEVGKTKKKGRKEGEKKRNERDVKRPEKHP